MALTLRQGTPKDAEACGRICFEAFKTIAAAHNFPTDLPTAEIGIGLMAMLLGHPGYYVVVAEDNGTIVGSNAVDERSPMAGIGPITVDPNGQNRGVGRQLMEHVMVRQAERRVPGVRLVQAAYHNRSLSLYTKLGFDPREPLSCIQGPPLGKELPGFHVRPAVSADLAACNELCVRVHGHTRDGEVLGAIEDGTATVVERLDRIRGYATGVAFFAHAVAETNEGLAALIAAAPMFLGPGFLVPTRNATLLRWCLANGLRIVQPMTLMTLGLYNEPQGAYLPSIAY